MKNVLRQETCTDYGYHVIKTVFQISLNPIKVSVT